VVKKMDSFLGSQPADVAHDALAIGSQATPEERAAMPGMKPLKIDSSAPLDHWSNAVASEVPAGERRGREREIGL
jgi:hypothetical protein